MVDNLLAQSLEREILLDGAMGSTLIEKGLSAGTPPSAWNVSHPEDIRSIHKAYFNAGAEIALTNTFGANRLKLKSNNLADKIRDFNIAGARIARSVCPPDHSVVGNIGPTGKLLKPAGPLTVEEVYQVFREQASLLQEAKVDLFLVETMYDIREAVAAVKAIKDTTGLPVIASMTFKESPRGFFTMMGNSVEECIRELENAGTDGIGTNCTLTSGKMVGLVEVMKPLTQLPLMARPNAGIPKLVRGKTVYHESPKIFSQNAIKMVEKGVNLIGGCCGTTPKHISQLAHMIRNLHR